MKAEDSKICDYCKKETHRTKKWDNWRWKRFKFCSRTCQRKGKNNKGQIPWNKGLIIKPRKVKVKKLTRQVADRDFLCKRCKLVKHATLFNHTVKHYTGKLYVREICKLCQKEVGKGRDRGDYNKTYSRKYIKDPKNQIKIKARQAVHRAIRLGEMIRQDSCSICGSKLKVEAHHPDYTKPLAIVWLCKVHHYKADNNLL